MHVGEAMQVEQRRAGPGAREGHLPAGHDLDGHGRSAGPVAAAANAAVARSRTQGTTSRA